MSAEANRPKLAAKVLTVSDGVVIRVELIAPDRITGFVAGEMRLEQKGVEKPGGVGEMPFRRTGIGHALQSKILRLERSDQGFTALSHIQQGVEQQGGSSSSPGP